MGIFSKLAQGLKKTKEAIAKKFYSLFTGRALDDEFYEDLENVLISSDVGVEATEQILERFKDECFERRISKADDAKELLRQIMVESIDYEIAPYEYPLIILVAGVNGVGKTTAIGKLAKFFKSRGKSVVMAAADTFRAAAGEQLEVWSQRAGVRLIKHEEGGRLQNKKNLMNELAKINKVVERECPNADYRTYIVLDATTGQNALSQVQEFDEIIDIDGIILNKMDGTAKGGVVFAISAERELPVVFVGVGEKIDDLAEFDAKTFIDSIFE